MANRMKDLWAEFDRALRLDTGLLIEIARAAAKADSEKES